MPPLELPREQVVLRPQRNSAGKSLLLATWRLPGNVHTFSRMLTYVWSFLHSIGQRRRCLAFFLCLLAIVSASCSSAPPPAPSLVVEPDPGLRPGDSVRLQVWREQDLSGTFAVDDRGIVNLPLLGELQVAGRDFGKLREDLVQEYRLYLTNPTIEVTVLRRLTILGAVAQPGLYPVDATISLSDALGIAGGITPAGNPDDIRLIRNGQMIRQELDQTTTVGGVDIRSGDQIVVSEKGWLARNPGALFGSLIGVATVVISALLR